MNSTRRALLFLLFIIYIFMASGLNAQDVDTRPLRGFMPNMDQLSSPIDNIDVATGKLHLQIPLASLPRGKGGTGFDLNLYYNSNIYDLMTTTLQVSNGSEYVTYNRQSLTVGGGDGWLYGGFEIQTEVKFHQDIFINTDPNCADQSMANIYRRRIQMPDGSNHIMALKGYDSGLTIHGYTGISPYGTVYPCGIKWGYVPVNGLLTYYTTDGTNLKYEVNTNDPWHGTLYFPDGSRWVEASDGLRKYDANGNYITLQAVCDNECDGLYMLIMDQNGKYIYVDHDVDAPNKVSDEWVRDRVTGPGPNGNVVYTIDRQYTTIGADNRLYSQGYNEYDQYNPNDLTQLSSPSLAIKYLHLPRPSDSSGYTGTLGEPPTDPTYSYTFGYWDDNSLLPDLTPNPGYGQLNYMKLPSGAEYRYYYKIGEDADGAAPSGSVFGSEDITHRTHVYKKTVDADGTQFKWNFQYLLNAPLVFTNPDGGKTLYGLNSDKLITLIQAFANDGLTVNTETKRFWANNVVPYYLSLSQNSYMEKEIVSIRNSASGLTKSAITTFSYDYNNNLLAKTEYDWVPYLTNGSPTLNGSTIKRKTQMDYYVPASAYPYWNEHVTSIWPTGTSRRLNAVQRQTVYEGASTPKAATEYIYDNPYSKGNVIEEKHWDSAKSASLPSLGNMSIYNSQVLTRSYDSYGNLTDKYEPEVRTHITYDPTGSRVTRVDTAYQTTAQRSIEYNWNTDGTALLSKKDLDNNQTTYFTYDNVGRQLITDEPDLRKTVTEYDDLNRTVKVKNDLKTYTDGKLQSISHYDRLGRIKLVQKSDGSPLSSYTDGIKTATYYRYLPYYANNPNVGRQVIATSPYRTSTDLTLEWTCTQYDLLGRVTEVASFNGSVPTTLPSVKCENLPNPTGITRTVYDADTLGNTVTITDPAGKARKQSSDVLGRLVTVVEDPSVVTPPYAGLNYTTTYNYDILGNLTQVTQGSQTRTFSYSSLGRLLTATNPESGTITYGYSDSGDLIKKTDPRGGTNPITSTIYTTMEYDPLHRIQKKSYINTNTTGALASIITPEVTYEYYLTGSSTSPNIGQLKKVSSSVGSTTYVYNELGKVSSSNTYNGFSGGSAFSYTYYLNGALKSELYPSGRLVNYDVDDAGRTNKVYTATTAYADEVSFAADGRLKQILLGNDLWETHNYQTPGATTPTSYMLGTTQGNGDITKLDYFFSPTQNNGNVQSQTILRNNNNSWSQSYVYDNVNRLLTVSETTGSNPWSQSYGYDQYGNRHIATSGLPLELHEPNSPSNFSAANNRLTTLPTNPVTTITYDAAGNQANYPPYTLNYDGENRNTVVKLSGSDYVTFSYDGDGRRVKKQITNGATTYYVYDAFGQMAAEYSTQPPTATGTSYMFTDMLGSVRTITDQNKIIIENYDYLPFGRMLNASTNGRANLYFPSDPDAPNALLNSKTPQKFTGKERDAETGLDYFGARYYSGAQGRFISADEPFADQDTADPQSWNLYSYVGNNPLGFIDEDGRGKIGIFYKVILKPIIKNGVEVMYRKTTKNAIGRDEAKRLLGKRGSNIKAPGRKSAKNAAGNGAKEHGAHGKGAGEDGPHFHTSDHNGGHSFFDGAIPGAALGVDFLGDNVFGQAVDLVNPLSDVQSIIDIYDDLFGPDGYIRASRTEEPLEEEEETKEPEEKKKEKKSQPSGENCKSNPTACQKLGDK